MSVFYPQARAILEVTLDGFGGPDVTITIPVIPKGGSIHRNSYNKADSWDLTFDAGDLPFDPQMVKGGQAEIYLYAVDGINDGTRVLSRAVPTAEASTNFKARGAVETSKLEKGMRDARTAFTMDAAPQIVGLFDEDSIEMSGGGKWVTLRGEDYTALLQAQQWPPDANGRARRIPTGKRLDLIVRDILEMADPTGRLSVAVRGTTPISLPIVGVNEIVGNARGIPVEQDTKYWDVIYKVVTRHGFVAYVDGLDVVIDVGGNLTDADAGETYLFAWGADIEHLRMSRKMSKGVAPTIVAKGYDIETRKPITVEWPQRGTQIHQRLGKSNKLTTRIKPPKKKPKRPRKPSEPAPKHTTSTEEYEIITIHGLSSEAALLDAARLAYESRGRAERTVVMRTRDLVDLRGRGCLQLKSGSPVMIDFQDFNREYILNPEVSEAEKVEYLVRKGYNEAVASQIASRASAIETLARPLRVKDVTMNFSSDEGISIELEAESFIVMDGARTPDVKVSRATKAKDKYRRVDGTRVGLGTKRAEDARVRRKR